MMMPTVTPEYDVPDDESPATACPYCERPFRDKQSRVLHVGEVHHASCTGVEREAFEQVQEDERGELFYYHLKIVIALGVIWGSMAGLYMIALGSGLL